jgi:hypothetical protein
VTATQWGPAPPLSPPTPPGQPAAPPAKRRSRNQTILLIAAAIGLTLLAVNAMISGGSLDSGGSQANPVSRGVGAKDAAGDVELLSFTDSGYGTWEIQLGITNHSAGTSDYYIELGVEDASGTNIGWTNALAQDIKSGQRAVATAYVTEEGAQKVVVTKVQRTASN